MPTAADLEPLEGERSSEARGEGAPTALRLEAIEARLARIERAFPWILDDAARPPTSPPEVEPSADRSERFLALSGRTLLILGGAYLLRAMTASEMVAPALGVIAGAIYGLTWLVPADRQAATGQRWSSIFFTLVSCLIVFPVLWETTTRFLLLTVPAAAGATTLVSAGILFVAWRRSKPLIGWIATASGLVTCLAIAGTTSDLIAPLAGATVLACFAWSTARSRNWTGLGEASALVVDLGALFLAVFAATTSLTPKLSLVWAETSLFVLYGLTFSINALRFGVRARVAERLQLGTAAVIGFGSSILFSGSDPHAQSILGLAALVATLGCLGGLIRTGPSTLFFSWSSFGFSSLAVYFLTASPTFGWLGLAIVALGVARKISGRSFRGLAAMYLVLASVSSGLLPESLRALLGTRVDPSRLLTLEILCVTGLTAIFLLVPRRDDQPSWPDLIVSWLLWGALVATSVSVVSSEMGWTDRGDLAALRTVVLAVSTLILTGWASRGHPLARRLVNPVLVAIGLKLLFQDLPWGRPFTLFVALFAYGSVLLVVPKILRRTATTQESSP